ncbi:MAG: GNAT family N-acetyltransferase [Peptococcaceae bacterium]|jgi:putative acetyltransferase|nr:GNAT family N-acetyltransferase [Peptococcaceae bacterium]
MPNKQKEIEFYIRRYRESDQNQIIRIWLNESLRAHSFIPAEFWEGHITTMQNKYLPEAETYVADSGGKILGFISLVGNYVAALFVDHSYQRQRVGWALMNFVHRIKGNLYVDVYKENLAAQQFYQSYGFQAKREQIQPETGHTMLTMYI